MMADMMIKAFSYGLVSRARQEDGVEYMGRWSL